MNYAQKILLILGGIFAGMGTLLTIIFLLASSLLKDFLTFALVPGIFIILGLAFIIGVMSSYNKSNKTIKYGTHYPAKIYGYVKNKSYTINGSFPINTKVHYFDRNHVEREAIIPTNFCEGSNLYPIGMTIDIYEYNGKYNFDPSSVRNEMLPGEQELMDDKPVDPTKLHYISAKCAYCGASYQAAAGYVGRCPYCGNYANMK